MSRTDHLNLSRARRTALALTLAGAGALVAATPASAAFPWPAPVAGGDVNPLLGTPYPANGSNATPDAKIVLRLRNGGRLTTVATTTVGGRPVVRGRLSQRATGKAIAGAVVTVARELADRQGWQAVKRVQTSKQGRFEARMSPAWAARRFAVTYWPLATSPLPVYSRRVLSRVAPKVWMRATPRGGGLVSLRGRVTGSKIPAGGLVVALQVRNRGGWVGVRLVRTTSSGRFSGRYRFSIRGRRYTMRAQVPRQPQWRLHTGTSAALRVRAR